MSRVFLNGKWYSQSEPPGSKLQWVQGCLNTVSIYIRRIRWHDFESHKSQGETKVVKENFPHFSKGNSIVLAGGGTESSEEPRINVIHWGFCKLQLLPHCWTGQREHSLQSKVEVEITDLYWTHVMAPQMSEPSRRPHRVTTEGGSTCSDRSKE